jgi:hypothetical protein
MSPKDKEPDPRDFRYLWFVTGRVKGMEDEDIAKKLHCGSVAHLYQRLSADGYPVCPACGAAPVRPGHCQEPASRRKLQNIGESRPLPPVSSASGLFRERIEALSEAIDNLSRLVVTARGESFVSTAVYDDPILLSRDELPEDEWRRVCESEGKDPASDRVLVTAGITRSPTGAAQAPPLPLVSLIAAYALSGGNMEELIKTLHPNPQEMDAQKLSRLLHARKADHGEDGLIRRAEQMATLVMGGRLGKGAPPPDLPPREHNAACYITHRREHGWSWDQICEELVPKGFTRDEVSRLGGLKLRWPEK